MSDSVGAGSGTLPVILGAIRGPYGVKGWVHINSRTRPAEQILEYDVLLVTDDEKGANSRRLAVAESKRASNGLKLRFKGFDTRNDAELLTGQFVGIDSEQLEPLPDGQYYWRDLIGMTVKDVEGFTLGSVNRMMETGANDVIVMDVGEGRERLIPWIPGVVIRVDMDKGELEIDWFEDD